MNKILTLTYNWMNKIFIILTYNWMNKIFITLTYNWMNKIFIILTYNWMNKILTLTYNWMNKIFTKSSIRKQSSRLTSQYKHFEKYRVINYMKIKKNTYKIHVYYAQQYQKKEDRVYSNGDVETKHPLLTDDDPHSFSAEKSLKIPKG